MAEGRAESLKAEEARAKAAAEKSAADWEKVDNGSAKYRLVSYFRFLVLNVYVLERKPISFDVFFTPGARETAESSRDGRGQAKTTTRGRGEKVEAYD